CLSVGLADHALSTLKLTPYTISTLVFAGNEDHRNTGKIFVRSDIATGLKAIHTFHNHIHQDNVRAIGFSFIVRLLTVGGGYDLITGVRNNLFQVLQVYWRIVHDHDFAGLHVTSPCFLRGVYGLSL